MSIDKLLELNAQGWVPGPDETYSTFFTRIQKTIEKQSSLKQEISIHFPDAGFPKKSPWLEIKDKLLSLCQCIPTHAIIFYSNKKLPIWHGAATWTEEGISVIQLKKGLQKGTYLGCYRKDDILLHEAVHVIRSAFKEPKFEEIIAYHLSLYPWRKYIGPLFHSSWESWLLIVLLFSAMLVPSILWAPALFLGYMLCRLVYHYIIFHKCLHTLSQCVGAKAYALIMRMSDKMIRHIARIKKESIIDFLEKRGDLPLNALLAALIRTWNS